MPSNDRGIGFAHTLNSLPLSITQAGTHQPEKSLVEDHRMRQFYVQ